MSIVSWLSTTFNWGKTEGQQSNPTKRWTRRPESNNVAEELVANRELTRGLYHGTYPGLKLASPLAFNPIAVPVWFMGIPIPTSDSPPEEPYLAEITELFSSQFPKIHTQCHREGTIWIWPMYSAKENRLLWEFIADTYVTDIIKDLTTGSIIMLIVEEQLTVKTGYDTTETIRRVRTFTRDKITIKYTGGNVPAELQSGTYRNPTRSLPIPFSNNVDGAEIRGHSDYERVLSDLKDYHDIDLQQSQTLAKFNVKLVQEVQDVQSWIDQNLFDPETMDIRTMDFILNITGKEKTELLSMDRAYEAYESALKRKFRKIIEGSGVPELVWGATTVGNHAAAVESMDTLVKFVNSKRDQKNDPYSLLFRASLDLLMARDVILGQEPGRIAITWSALDAVSDETRATIFKAFAQGAAALVNSSAATKEQLFKLWKALYPGATEDEYEDFEKGLSGMARHGAYSKSSYEMIRDLSGSND